MMRPFKIFACIADIHIGNRTVTAESLKSQLKKHFFKPLQDLPYLDGILVLGDIMHTVVSLNSDYSELFHWFIDKLYRLARKRKCLVVIIRGTLSHDSNMLDNIRSYVNNEDDVDFRIYDTVEETNLWGNYKTLILPDVKVKQLEEIDKYLEEPGKYDLILGHGMITQLQYVQQESENMPTKTYVYDAGKLMRACKGPILFGHVHQYQHLMQKFYYVGPFTMLERGWYDAGFAIVGIYDKDRTKFKVEHYINPDSAQFYEMVVTRKILETIPIDEIIEAIDDTVNQAKSNDLITLRITRGSENESVEKVMLIENRYRNDKRISIVKKVKSAQEAQQELAHEEAKKKYAYLLDESIELPSLVYQYYLADYKPTLPDQRSPEASLVENDFIEAFKIGEKS